MWVGLPCLFITPALAWADENVVDWEDWRGYVLKNCYAPWYLEVSQKLTKRRSAVVMELFFNSVGQDKSAWYETARNLFRSRNTQRARAERLTEENCELRLQNEQLRESSQASKRQLKQTQQLLQQEQQANAELRRQPITLPSDLALPNHTFGPKIISLCLNPRRITFAKKSGFAPPQPR